MDDMNQMQCENQINLLDYVKVIFKHKRLIVYIVAVGVILTAIVSMLMNPVYEARAVVAPVQQSAAQSSMSAIAAQFGMFGIATPQSANVSEMINLLKSDILMQKIMEKNNLYDVFFKKNAFKGKNENQKAWEGIRALREVVKVSENKKEQTLVLTARYKDPRIVEQILDYTLKELTEFMSNEAKRVADANRKHLEAQIEKTTDPFIRQKIYALIAQQIENAMMAEVKENFAFKMIDPPRIPDQRIKPKRRQMVMIAFVISLFLGIFMAFVKEYCQNHREELGEFTSMLGLKKFTWKRFRGKENNI